MKDWLVGIAVFSTLSAVADMLLPRSVISRYAKLCVAVVLTAIIIIPIANWYNNGFFFDMPRLPETTQQKTEATLVDIEFSKRFTDALRVDTGLNDINVNAILGYDTIDSLHISGVAEEDQPLVNKLLAEKYNIPSEIVQYG